MPEEKGSNIDGSGTIDVVVLRWIIVLDVWYEFEGKSCMGIVTRKAVGFRVT